LIFQKVAMASEAGGGGKDPAVQIRLLMSAFADAEWVIGDIAGEFRGVKMPSEAQSMISSVRAVESSIMSQIRSLLGINLSDDELKALLQKDPKDAQGNPFSLNWLIQKDKQMTPDPQADPNQNQTGKPNPFNQQNAAEQENINGIRSNPAKYMAALSSANQKIVKEMKSIMKQVAALLQAVEQNPEGNIGNLMAALALLNRGQLISMVAEALTGFSPANKADGSFDETHAAFDELLNRARALMAKQGLPPDLLDDKAVTAQKFTQVISRMNS